VSLSFLGSDAASFAAFRQGKLDASPLPTGQAGPTARVGNVIRVPGLTSYHLTLNQQMPPFDDVHCRLAVAYALNRTDITAASGGRNVPSYTVVPPGVLGDNQPEDGVPMYDPVRARSEMALCPGGLREMTIVYPWPDQAPEYKIAASDLLAVGVHVTLRRLASYYWLQVVAQNLNAGGHQAVANVWIPDYPDPQAWFGPLLHSGGAFNIGGFHNPTVDRLIDRAAVDADPATRARLYGEAQRRALRRGAWIAIGVAAQSYVVSRQIRGFDATVDGLRPAHGDWSSVTLTR